MENKEAIIRKIRGLLSLSDSSTFPEESAQALLYFPQQIFICLQEKDLIDRAAISYKGIWSVPRPGRHHDVIAAICDTLGLDQLPHKDSVQGFVDENGVFFDRELAGIHAIQCGQIKELRWPPRLYSEDLW